MNDNENGWGGREKEHYIYTVYRQMIDMSDLHECIGLFNRIVEIRLAAWTKPSKRKKGKKVGIRHRPMKSILYRRSEHPTGKTHILKRKPPVVIFLRMHQAYCY